MIIHEVEQCTDEWYTLRAGIPTASEAGKLISGAGKESKQVIDYGYQLAGELYAGMPLDMWEGNRYTERGKDLESIAISDYELLTGAWTERVGFCTNNEGTYGCSPDGLLEAGMVEIKCLSAKHHVRNIVYYNKHKKAAPDYIPQTQMQMLVCEREWCDLVFYHPELPMLIIRQKVILEIQNALVAQIDRCIGIRDEALKIIESNL